MTDFTWDSVVDVLNSNNVPEICLLVMGLVAIAMVIAYRHDKDSFLYKILMLVGVIVGVFMVYVAVAIDTGWHTGTMIILTIACFTLIIRPFREINFSLILSLLLMAIIYVWMGGLTGDLAFLAETWPRIIAAVVVGAIVYMITGFIQDIVQLFGKVLNAWPFLLIIGIWCIVEAVFLFTGNGTVFDYVSNLINGNSALIL